MLKWLRRLFRNEHTGGEQIVPSASAFARIIGYRFRRRALLVQALKHRSFLPQVNEQRPCSNERMELLGDAVLGIVVTEHLYHKYPDKEEGEITAIKSRRERPREPHGPAPSTRVPSPAGRDGTEGAWTPNATQHRELLA